jgi:hypothetical protein
MNKDEKRALQTIEDQLYAINARNISMGWIGMQHTPTMEEISELNAMLGFIIKEIRILRKTGKLDVEKLHSEHFKEEKWKKICTMCRACILDKGRAIDGRRAYHCKNTGNIWTEGKQGKKSSYSEQRQDYHLTNKKGNEQ